MLREFAQYLIERCLLFAVERYWMWIFRVYVSERIAPDLPREDFAPLLAGIDIIRRREVSADQGCSSKHKTRSQDGLRPQQLRPAAHDEAGRWGEPALVGGGDESEGAARGKGREQCGPSL